ncbi:MAG TPA: hemolysin III family protein [Candidatus Aphodovivens avistercoris]|nr:hemolysin III family protein [Candidatus Aphodovivens avistercoris]
MNAQATSPADGGGRSSRPAAFSARSGAAKRDPAASASAAPSVPTASALADGEAPVHEWTPSQFRPRTAREAYAHRDERAATPANARQRKRNVREYTLGEEIANSVTHGIGAVLALAAIPILVVEALGAGGGIYLFTALVYALTMLLEYLMSTLYHAISADKAKRVFKVLDHSCIYLFIAGTYTPFCLVTLAPFGGVWLAAFVWAVALAGVATESFWVFRPRWVSAVLYLLLGWSVVWFLPQLIEALPGPGMALLAAGGACYTIGCVFYVLKKVRYMHTLFHVWVLAGSVCHFLAVVLFVI